MKNFLTHTFRLTAILLVIIFCGPIHMVTYVKKVPKEYSMNYCGGKIKVPKIEINNKYRIVYSDKVNNATYNKVDGKSKQKI